jgi:hypothetical protein
MITLSLGVALSYFHNLNRIVIAEDAQVEESKFLRFFPLLYFSLREALLVPLVYAIIVFIIGRLLTKSKPRKTYVFSLTIFFLWVQCILIMAETITYYATWHHTPLQVLVYIIAFELGRKAGPVRKNFKATLVTSITVVVVGQFLSGTQMAAYANHWDTSSKENFQDENSLELPRNLGIRTDSYWVNFVTKEQKMILMVKVSEGPVQALEPIYLVFNLPLVTVDWIVSVFLNEFDGAERITLWQI